MINLGDKVKDKYSGFVGIVVARTEFINGCIQYEVVARTKDNKPPEEVGIDADSLEVVKPKTKPAARKVTKSPLGGPYKSATKMRGY